ncbi:hypothetical protein TNCV_2591471 [Trichonephila clavipes]|nr:hypothetical protein TNCV_2591471 [Trichonephila clavipes]
MVILQEEMNSDEQTCSSELRLAFYFRPDGTNGNQSTRYYQQLRREKQLSLEIEALDIVINRCTELVNFPDTDDNHEMKAILRASIDDTPQKKDTMVIELSSLPSLQFSKLTPIIQSKPLMRSHAPAIPLVPATDFHAHHHQPRGKTKPILKQDRGLRD